MTELLEEQTGSIAEPTLEPISEPTAEPVAASSAAPFVYDVIVVGGGPIGTTAARYAKLNNIPHVLVIEENASIGSPVECTGLLSAAALKETDMEPDPSFVFNSVKGAAVYPPNGRCLKIEGKEVKAHVVSRKMFDRQLAQKAASAGAIFQLKTQAVGLRRETVGHEVWALDVISGGRLKTLYSKIIIAADGVRSRTARRAGLEPCEKVLSGIQIEAVYHSEDTDFVEMFAGSQAPGFFGWTVPVNAHISRIGLAIDLNAAAKQNKKNGNAETGKVETKSAYDYLSELLQNPILSQKRMGGDGNTDFVVGGIPIGPMKKTYAAGLMVVGDAAGQCKPISGGGIYTGAVAAKIAAGVAAEAILENDFSEKKMRLYEKRWKKELGRELDIGMAAHAYRAKLEDKEMNEIFEALNDPEILTLITQYGDMDHPSVLIRKLMLSKQSLKMMKLAGTFFKSVL